MRRRIYIVRLACLIAALCPAAAFSHSHTVEIKHVTPSEFSDFANYVRVNAISFKSETEAHERVSRALAAWAPSIGYRVNEFKLRPAAVSPDNRSMFFRLAVTDYTPLRITAYTTEFADETPEADFSYKIPSPPDFFKKKFNPRDFQNAINAYIERLKNDGFLLARYQIIHKNISPEGAEFHLQFTLNKRYQFEFAGTDKINNVLLRQQLAASIQAQPTPESMAHMIEAYYHSLGFKDAQCRPLLPIVAPEERLAIYRFEITEGRQYQLYAPKFSFSGLTKDYTAAKRAYHSFLSQDTQRKFYSERHLEIFAESFVESVKEDGYYDARIALNDIHVSRDQSWVTPLFDVDLGAQTYLDAVEFESLPPPASQKQFQAYFAHLSGRPLQKTAVQKAIDRAHRTLFRMGFITSTQAIDAIHVFSEHPTSHKHVKLIITYNPGPRYFLEDVIYYNTCETSKRYLDHYLKIRPGDAVDPERVKASVTSLYTTDLFRAIDVETQDVPQKDRVDRTLIIRGQCASRGLFEMGGGLYTEQGIQIFSKVGYRNLWRANQQATLYGALGVRPPPDIDFIQTHLNLQFFWPYILHLPFDFRLNAVFLTRDNLDFDFRRFTAGFSLERWFANWLKLTLDLYSFTTEKRFNFFNDPQYIELSHHGEVGTSLFFNFSNHKFAPTRGHQHTLSAQFAFPFLGTSADVSFYRLTTHHSFYVPIMSEDRFVWASYLKLGWVQTISAPDHIPRDQFFFLGGDGSLRGFDYKSLGLGVATHQQDIKNMAAVNLSIELRFRLLTDFYTFLFFDTGRVWANRAPISPYRMSSGAGFRLQTPLGAIQLVLGVPVDRHGPPPNQVGNFATYKIHLSLTTF